MNKYLIVKPSTKVNRRDVRIHAVDTVFIDGMNATADQTLCGILWYHSHSQWIHLGTYGQPYATKRKVTCGRCLRTMEGRKNGKN